MANTSYSETVIRQTHDKNRVRVDSSIWITLGAAILVMAMIAAINLGSPRTLFSFHGFIHAAIAEEFLPPVHLAFPPENPFYAGEPLPYYWFFQFLGAQVSRLFSWNVFFGMKALIILAAGALVAVAAVLGRRLYRSTIAGLMVAFLILAGTNPFGILIAGLKVVQNGTQVLRDDPNFLWGVVHPIYSLMRFNDIGALYGPLLNFYLNLTSRPVALASLLTVLLCLQWLFSSSNHWAFWMIVVLSGLTTALSPIIGIAAGGALVGGMLLWWAGERFFAGKARSGSRPEWKLYAFAIAALLLGIVIAWPTYAHLVFGPSDSQMRFWLFSRDGLRHLLTVGLTIIPLYLLALAGFRRWPQRWLGILLVAASLLLAAAIALEMPSWNQSNFFHAAVVILSVPAAGWIVMYKADEVRVSGRQAVLLGLFFLPTTVLLVSAYMNRPPLPAVVQGYQLHRLPVGSDLASLYDWVQKSTSPKAIFVLDPRNRVTMVGNTTEFPVMAGRPVFTENQDHYLVSPYSDSQLRVQMAEKLVTGESLTQSEKAYLADFHRPLYIVCSGQCEVARMGNLYGSPVFEKGSVRVFLWQADTLGGQ